VQVVLTSITSKLVYTVSCVTKANLMHGFRTYLASSFLSKDTYAEDKMKFTKSVAAHDASQKNSNALVNSFSSLALDDEEENNLPKTPEKFHGNPNDIVIQSPPSKNDLHKADKSSKADADSMTMKQFNKASNVNDMNMKEFDNVMSAAQTFNATLGRHNMDNAEDNTVSMTDKNSFPMTPSSISTNQNNEDSANKSTDQFNNTPPEVDALNLALSTTEMAHEDQMDIDGNTKKTQKEEQKSYAKVLIQSPTTTCMLSNIPTHPLTHRRMDVRILRNWVEWFGSNSEDAPKSVFI
jgi:hypothetical protein